MKKPLRSRIGLLTLLLLPALAFGPFGCGPEIIPIILVAAGTASAVAFTFHQLQEITSADLDIKMKQLRLRGMQNGQVTTLEQPLNDAQVQEITHSGKVTVNGVVVPVSRAE